MDKYEYCEYSVSGFELYIVEQWVSERKFTSLITSFTGNSNEVIHGILVRLPENLELWPAKLKDYYESLLEFAAIKEIDEKISIFVTNLSYFPSTLNLLHVKSGSMKECWPLFQINFDLKRIGCGGRSGILFGDPSITSLEKFVQIYKITTKNLDQTKQNVVGLVRIIQISLTYFRLLESDCKDGTLCQFTANSIDEWWVTYGKLYLGIDRPKNEGILGPTTVAGIISFVLTCYFKFIVEDCISFKDPYNETSFYSGVYNFQKKHNLPKTSYLDIETMNKLFKVTSKNTNTDIFKLKRVLKSRVQDIAGKVNPVQLANEILTTDLDWLIQNVQGGYLSLLWDTKGASKSSWSTKTFYNQKYSNGNPLKSRSSSISLPDLVDYNTDSRSPKSKAGEWKVEACPELHVLNDHHSSNNTQFQKELYRRASIPQIEMDMNLFQTEYKNNILTEEKVDSYHFKRSQSFSNVQDIMETWELPFQISPIKMANEILFMERELRRKCVSDVGKESNQANMQALSKTFEDARSKINDMKYMKAQRINKHEELLSAMKEVDSLEARFHYDVRILDTRMRDVEESLTQFGNKLDSLEENLKSKSKQFKALIDTNILHSALELDKHAFEFFESEQVWSEGYVIRSVRTCIWPTIKAEYNRITRWWTSCSHETVLSAEK